MAEEPGQDPNTEPATGQPEDPERDLPDTVKAILAKERTARREADKRARDNQKAVDRLAEIEAASKTDLQKANERAEAAERRAAELQTANTRAAVAAEFDIPVELVSGVDEDAMRAVAARAKEWRESAPRTTPPPHPASLHSGAANGTQQLTGKERAAQALRDLRRQ